MRTSAHRSLRLPVRLLLLVLVLALGWSAPPAATAGGAAGTPAPAAKAPGTPLKVVTANLDFGNGPRGERQQLAHVLAGEPDVVLLQELRDVDLRSLGGRVPGLDKYGVVQKTAVGSQTNLRGSGILFLKSRFGEAPVSSGFPVGYAGVRGVTEPRSRLLPWAILDDLVNDQEIAVISVHMPKKAATSRPYREAYSRMIRNYQKLVIRFRGKSLPVVAGGDWNAPLQAKRNEPTYGPVRGNTSVGLRFNWSYGTPCRETHGGRSKIDGLAWRGPVTRVVSQRCLARKNSDHRPVQVVLALTDGGQA